MTDANIWIPECHVQQVLSSLFTYYQLIIFDWVKMCFEIIGDGEYKNSNYCQNYMYKTAACASFSSLRDSHCYLTNVQATNIVAWPMFRRPTLLPDQVQATNIVTWPMFRRPTLLPDQCSGDQHCYRTNVQATNIVTWPMFRPQILLPDQCSSDSVFSIIQEKTKICYPRKLYQREKAVATHSTINTYHGVRA